MVDIKPKQTKCTHTHKQTTTLRHTFRKKEIESVPINMGVCV